MPRYVFYDSLLVGLLTTIVMSLILSRKFGPLKLWRKLSVASAGLLCGFMGAIFGIVVASTAAEYYGWPQFVGETLTPTTQYLRWMYTGEAFFVAMIMGGLIFAMDRGQRLAEHNRSYRRG